jgi:hypothetical protein
LKKEAKVGAVLKQDLSLKTGQEFGKPWHEDFFGIARGIFLSVCHVRPCVYQDYSGSLFFVFRWKFYIRILLPGGGVDDAHVRVYGAAAVPAHV